MSYIKTTWVTGDIVTAPRMNNIENGIYNNDAAISALQTEVTDTETDVTNLQGDVSTLQTNVTALQTTTGNLIPSIAEVFSTSSTYAVGDHVMYNGRLYECKTAVTTAGAWNASNWDAVSVYKYDDLVGVIKITDTSTTMATIETTLANVNAAGDHVVFDVSALSEGMRLCTIYLNNGRYHIVDITTGYEGDGTYSSTDTLASILAKGSEPFYITDTTPYLFRQTPYSSIGNKEILEQLVGGSLGWNQLIPQITATAAQYGITYVSTGNGTWTITGALESGQNQGWYNLNYTANVQKILNGHVYYVSGCDTEMRLQFLGNGTGALSTVDAKRIIKISLATGDTSTWVRFQTLTHSTLNKTLTPQVIDLTAMFGSTIADYIYSLESATAGAGIAKLKSWGIDLDTYHVYDAGSIQSVEATAHITRDANDNIIGNYPLGSDTLRGIPQLVNNELQYDGDVKTADGTITRNYGIVDLGTLNWTAAGTMWVATLNGVHAVSDSVVPNAICGKYVAVSWASGTSGSEEKVFCVLPAYNQLRIRDTSYTSASAFAAGVTGTYLVYPLATPTTESGTAYQRIQTVDADGTEEFVSNTVVPVGHYTQYPQNTLALLSEISDPVSSVPIPNAPSTNGTYTLKVVVSNGTPTYTWVTG